MKVYDFEQGSEAWLRARSGIPTSSAFDQIVTKSGKPSKSAKPYMHTLLAERIMGRPITQYMSTWMQRGRELEAQAVDYYEMRRDLDTRRVGFITNDEGTIGASPDRLVGEEGLVELKVPKEHVHVSYLLERGVDAEYRVQVAGQLWITGRKWVDVCSYHPEMPPAIIRVERDEDFIDIVADAVEAFSRELEKKTLELRDRGWLEVRDRDELLAELAKNAPPSQYDIFGSLAEQLANAESP